MSRQTSGHLLLNLATILSLSVLAACDIGSQGGGGAPSVAPQASVDAGPAEATEGAGPALEGAPQRPVVAETLPYAEVDEELVYGHFVFPADMVDPLPGVIVIHEWWGLNDEVRAMADRIAAQGYVVLAVDLFAGGNTRSPAEARQLTVDVVENPELANENIRQAYQFLVDSGQAPYGQVTDNQSRLEPVNVPILGLFGANDRGIPVAIVRNFEEALEILEKNYEIEIYPGVGHAFANPVGPNYNAVAAEQAWARTLEFLDKHLSVAVD
jgi:carboxymethylenebutenolidase